MKTILILEDNDERVAAFEKTIAALNPNLALEIWRDAFTMIRECEPFFSNAVLISLDHDLNPQPGVTADPGTGLDVAEFLADFPPICPVIIHSSNTERAYSMQNELRFALWDVERVGPLGNNWIETSWIRRVEKLLAEI